MQILRQLTWLFFGGLHVGLLLALIGCSGTPPLTAAGPQSDTVPVDQRITSGDKSKLTEPEPVIETSAIPQEEFSTQCNLDAPASSTSCHAL